MTFVTFFAITLGLFMYALCLWAAENSTYLGIILHWLFTRPAECLSGQTASRMWLLLFWGLNSWEGWGRLLIGVLLEILRSWFGPFRVSERNSFESTPAVLVMLSFSQVFYEQSVRVLSVCRTFGSVNSVEVIVSIWFSSSERIGKCYLFHFCLSEPLIKIGY